MSDGTITTAQGQFDLLPVRLVNTSEGGVVAQIGFTGTGTPARNLADIQDAENVEALALSNRLAGLRVIEEADVLPVSEGGRREDDPDGKGDGVNV